MFGKNTYQKIYYLYQEKFFKKIYGKRREIKRNIEM